MPSAYWSEAHADRLVEILRRHAATELKAALAEAGRAFGLSGPLETDKARGILRNHGKRRGYSMALTDHCKRAFEAPPAPPPAIELPSIFEEDDEAETRPHLKAETPEQWWESAKAEALEKQARAEAARVEAAPDPAKMLEERAEERERRRLKSERDALLDQLQEANARARFLDGIRVPTVPVIERRERTSGLREGTFVALASDWHSEEEVDPAAIAFVNEYNMAIAEARAARFFDGIEWLLAFERQAFKIRDVVLWFGGDLYSGHIHEENVETSALSPVESVLFVRRMLTTGIRRLLADPLLERLVIPCSYGNHGRDTPKRRIATGAKHSYEWLMYQVMADEFANDKRVTFSADQSAHQYVSAYDRTLHFTHGDEVGFGGGVGGISIPLNKRIPAWDRVKQADVHHIGHFHQYLDLNRCVLNGSLIGFNSYAQSIGASPEPPRQAAYVYDSLEGKCLVTPIWVGEKSRAAA